MASEVPLSEAGVPQHVRRLIADAKRLAHTELALQKLRLALAGKLAGRIAVFGVAALIFLHFTLVALVVGLLFALAPVIGAWAALASVAGGLLLITAIAGLVAFVTVRRLRALITDVAANP